MKITQIRDDGKVYTCRLWDIAKLMEQLKVETKSKQVSCVRETIPYLTPESRSDCVKNLPKLLPAAAFTRLGTTLTLSAYTGVVMIDVNHLAGEQEVNRIKEIAAHLPQTFAAFKGSSGRSVKIWIRFTYPDDGLPQEEEKAELFHAHAYRLAVKFYQPQLPFEITLQTPSLTQYCRWTHDTDPYFNPQSLPIYLDQPFEMPGDTTYREQVDAERSPYRRMTPGYASYNTFGLLFETALHKAFEGIDGWQPEDDCTDLLIRVAKSCFRAGIPEEETVRRAGNHFNLAEQEQLVRTTISNVYMQCKGFNSRSSLSGEQLLALRTEEFMSRRYEFRYNSLTTHVEYRERCSFHFYFRPVNKRTAASMVINAMHEGLKIWDRDVVRYLESDRVPLYNPIEEFLNDLPAWDGIDRIDEVSKRIRCSNPHWPLLFQRWFLCMVAHWRGIDRRHANSTSPLLIGPQGYRKSTFCKLLLPPALQAYYTDSIDFSRKRDAELYLNRFALINMDEFDQIGPNQQAFLKHILQKPSVQTRRPNTSTVDELRRYASFIATSNHHDVLSDTSGTRRFIAIKLIAPIETSKPINYSQLYAQAMHLLRSGERYWFDSCEEALLTTENEAFEQSPVIEQLFQLYYRAAVTPEEGEWLLAADIFQNIQKRSRMKMGNSQIITLGRIMKRLGTDIKRYAHGTRYHVVALKK